MVKMQGPAALRSDAVAQTASRQVLLCKACKPGVRSRKDLGEGALQ